MSSDASVKLEWPDPDSVNTVPYQDKLIPAYVCKVYDGDTCTVIIKFGEEFMRLNIRVEGVDTPELRIYDKQRKNTRLGQLEKKAGKHVRDKIRGLIENKECKVKLMKWDKYGGRVIGSVHLRDTEQSLSEYLIRNKYAKPYQGAKNKDGQNQSWRRFLVTENFIYDCK